MLPPIRPTAFPLVSDMIGLAERAGPSDLLRRKQEVRDSRPQLSVLDT